MSVADDFDACVNDCGRAPYYRTGECLLCYARRRRRTVPGAAEKEQARSRRWRAKLRSGDDGDR